MTADELAKLLDTLGQRLGPTGQHVFELAVRQVYIDAATAAIALVITLIVGAVVAPRLYRWRSADDADDAGGRDILLMFPAALYGCAVLFMLWWALASIPAILNPEYAAIRDILHAIGSVK